VAGKDIFDNKVLICGCGNTLFGDDGFGPEVISYLRNHCHLPAGAGLIEVGATIWEMLVNLAVSEKKPHRLIIVDAVDESGRQPGEVFELSVDEIPAKKMLAFSLHQFPAVNILKDLQKQTGMDIRLLAAQVQSLPKEVSLGLSPPLAAAVETACQRLVAILADSGVTVENFDLNHKSSLSSSK